MRIPAIAFVLPLFALPFATGSGRVGVALSVASVDRLCRTSGGAESVAVVD